MTTMPWRRAFCSTGSTASTEKGTMQIASTPWAIRLSTSCTCAAASAWLGPTIQVSWPWSLPNWVTPVLQKARRQSIVVISHEASGLTNIDYDIEAFDNHAYGAKLMEVLGRDMGGEGKYVATVGSLTSQSQMEWIDGAVAYQKQHFPKMQEATRRIETYDDATTDYNKLKEVLTAYPDLKGILGAPMPTSAGAGRLIAERNLKGKLFFSGTGLVSVAGQYLRNGDVNYIQFWDPAVAGYAMNVLAVMALAKKDIKPGLDLGLAGYNSLQAPDAKKPNALVGQGWVGVTKDNMAQYNF
jgi:simple sugar transport system substrate-binding protein